MSCHLRERSEKSDNIHFMHFSNRVLNNSSDPSLCSLRHYWMTLPPNSLQHLLPLLFEISREPDIEVGS